MAAIADSPAPIRMASKTMTREQKMTASLRTIQVVCWILAICGMAALVVTFLECLASIDIEVQVLP